MKRRSLFDHLALQRLCEHDPPCGEKDLKHPDSREPGCFFMRNWDFLCTERNVNKTFTRKGVFLVYVLCTNYVFC